MDKPVLIVIRAVNGGFMASDASDLTNPDVLHPVTCIGTSLVSCINKLPEAILMAGAEDQAAVEFKVAENEEVKPSE